MSGTRFIREEGFRRRQPAPFLRPALEAAADPHPLTPNPEIPSYGDYASPREVTPIKCAASDGVGDPHPLTLDPDRCTCDPAPFWERKADRSHFAGCPQAEPWQRGEKAPRHVCSVAPNAEGWGWVPSCSCGWQGFYEWTREQRAAEWWRVAHRDVLLAGEIAARLPWSCGVCGFTSNFGGVCASCGERIGNS